MDKESMRILWGTDTPEAKGAELLLSYIQRMYENKDGQEKVLHSTGDVYHKLAQWLALELVALHPEYEPIIQAISLLSSYECWYHPGMRISINREGDIDYNEFSEAVREISKLLHRSHAEGCTRPDSIKVGKYTVAYGGLAGDGGDIVYCTDCKRFMRACYWIS